MSVKHSRTPVPVLLDEFPVPPTFIPQNPSNPPNPPPSRPPSLPLPPIPGPSPLSEQDLYHITAAARSRRASRLSSSSHTSSWRESVASVASTSSGRSSHAAPASTTTTATAHPPGRKRTGSVTSISAFSVRSYSSQNGILSVPLSSHAPPRVANPDNHRLPPKSVAVKPPILEDVELSSVSATEPSLNHTSSCATPSPQPHIDDSTLHGERLSSIDMRDLPALQDDDTIDLDSQAHSLHLQMRALRTKSTAHKFRIRQAMPQPQPNSQPTGGIAHKRTLSATQHARSRSGESFHDNSHAPMAFPGIPLPDGSDRASSPDVASFIAATPRPRRRSETSNGSKSRSQSRRAPKSLPGSCRTSAVGRFSAFSLPDECARQGSISIASRSLLPYDRNADNGDTLWNDGSLLDDYGLAIGGGDGDFANVPDDYDDAGDSDSSLDLHTPLPYVLFSRL
jgi:hypothetical protein